MIRFVCLFLALFGICKAQDLIRLGPCKLVPTTWADGDSFLVEGPDGKQITLRLYGADCIEWHVIWANTDWMALPDERRLERQDHAELAEAAGDAALPSGQKIDPNTAARDQLMRLPGIGEKIANRIIEGRPYKSLEDLGQVQGIGSGTLRTLKPHIELKGVK